MKIVDESILFFSRVSLSIFSLESLNIFSGNSQYFMGMKGIYTCVCLECEELVFFKTELVGDLAS